MNVAKDGAKIILTWKKDDAEDIAKARDFFQNLTKQGWLATRRSGGLRRKLDFKSEYEELVFIPFAEGG
jgi:hypothetical protein